MHLAVIFSTSGIDVVCRFGTYWNTQTVLGLVQRYTMTSEGSSFYRLYLYNYFPNFINSDMDELTIVTS